MRKPILLLVIMIICVTAAGCAYHGPLSLPPAPAGESASLVVITEKSIWTKGTAIIVVLDGTETYSLNHNQYIVYRISPGEHTIIGKLDATTDKSIAKVNLSPGDTVYLYFVGHQRPLRQSYVSVTRIPEEQALKYMKNATRVGPQ